MVSTFLEFIASLGVAFSWIFSSRMKPDLSNETTGIDCSENLWSIHLSSTEIVETSYISYTRGKVSHSICSSRFAVIAQWFPLPICICYRLFSHVSLQLPSQSSASIAPCTFTRIHLNRSMHRIASVGRTDYRISRPMATPESHFLTPVFQSPRTNRMKRAGFVVEWAWRFHPQNGCEIARALGSPFKINGRINSRGSRERRGKYASAYHPLSIFRSSCLHPRDCWRRR